MVARRIDPEDWDGEAFARRLRMLMEKAGLPTAEHLSRRLDVGKSTAHNWTHGKAPEAPYLHRLGRFFGVAMEWMCGEGQDAHPIPAPSSRHEAQDAIQAMTEPRIPGQHGAAERQS
jgi:hypothetical protein